MDKEYIAEPWEIYKHIDSIREGRTNFFLVAESMMIAAFMTLAASENFLKVVISLLGLVYTACWYFINLRQSNRLDYIANSHLLSDEMLLNIVKAGKGFSGKIIMNYILPISTGAFWLILMLSIWFRY